MRFSVTIGTSAINLYSDILVDTLLYAFTLNISPLTVFISVTRSLAYETGILLLVIFNFSYFNNVEDVT